MAETSLLSLDFTYDACPLSGVHGASHLAPSRVVSGVQPFGDRQFVVHECSSCGLGVTSPIPASQNAHLLYDDRTSDDFQPDEGKVVRRLKTLAAVRAAKRFVAHAPAGARRVLDFGCGNGDFVGAMSKAVPSATVLGSDFQRQPPIALAEANYLPYEDLAAHEGSFDIVLARHVLEHSYDPLDLLSRLRKVLTPEGVLVVEVPALETPMSRLFGRYWDGYYAPFHPLHFTKESLIVGAEAAGLDVVAYSGAEMPMVGRSIRNALGCSYGPWLFALGAALQPLQMLVGVVSRKPVCHRIWLTHRG